MQLTGQPRHVTGEQPAAAHQPKRRPAERSGCHSILDKLSSAAEQPPNRFATRQRTAAHDPRRYARPADWPAIQFIFVGCEFEIDFFMKPPFCSLSPPCPSASHCWLAWNVTKNSRRAHCQWKACHCPTTRTTVKCTVHTYKIVVFGSFSPLSFPTFTSIRFNVITHPVCRSLFFSLPCISFLQ